MNKNLETVSIIILLFGIPLVALASANAVTDTSFWFLKISVHNLWEPLVERGPSTPSVFDIVQSCVAVIMTFVVVRFLAQYFELNLKSFMRIGLFHWAFFPLVIIAPFILALPNFFARLLFGLPLPSDAVSGQSAALSITFLLAILVPIQEELIWRGLGVTLLEKRGLSSSTIIMGLSLGFMLAHLPSDIGILRPLALAPAAYILTWMRLRSGGIVWSFLFHAVGNGVISIGPFSSAVYKFVFGT